MLFALLAGGVGIGTFLGLIVCANADISSFSPTDLRKDLLRSATVTLVTASTGVALLALTSNPRVILGLLPVWYLVVKLCWLEMGLVDILILGGSTLLVIAILGIGGLMLIRPG